MGRRGDERSEDRRRIERWLAAVAGFVAFCIGVVSFGLAEDVRALDTQGITATGTIVGLSGWKNPELVVDYDTEDGTRVRAGTTAYVDVGDPGDSVEVVYDPKNPQLIRTVDWGVDYTGAVLLGLVALAGLGVAAWIWRYGVPDRIRPAHWTR